MMGHAHATTGAAGWVALTSTGAFGLGLMPLEPSAVLAWSLVAAGAALAADADHHSGTIAHSLPPFSGIVTRGVAAISGGHRHATHSVIGIAAFTALAFLAGLVRIDVVGREIQVGAGVLVLLLVAFALKSLRLTRGWISAWGISLAFAAAAVWWAPADLWCLPFAVGVGCFIHVAGDALTVQGVPWLWPINPKPPQGLVWLQYLVLLAPLWLGVALLVRFLVADLALSGPGDVLAAWGEPAGRGAAIVLAAALGLTAYVFFSGALDKGSLWKRNGYFALPVLGTAGSGREWLLVIVVDVYLALAITSLLAPQFLESLTAAL